MWRTIRAAAVALVGERGLAAVTVDDIAAAAGISRRTFFNYFATKASAVLDPDPELAASLAARLAATPPDGDPWTALRGVCTAFVTADDDRALPLRRRLIDEQPELGEYHALVHRHVELALLDWARRQVPGDPLQAQLLARTATAALGAAFLAWAPEQGTAGFADLVARSFDRVAVRPG